MRIGTYNVLGLSGYPSERARADLVDAARTVEHFADVFASLACDVLALQEGPDHATMRALARRLGCHLAAFPSPTAYPGYVLSRWPILESRVYAHAGPDGGQAAFSRCAGAALLQWNDGRLWVVGIHLHPKDRAMRRLEAQRLAGHLASLDGALPTVVLGDFNASLPEEVHGCLAARGFVNAMVEAGGGAAPTMDTAGVSPKVIDHIYVDGRLAGRLVGARVVRAPGFRRDAAAATPAWVHSDHLPVLADLEG